MKRGAAGLVSGSDVGVALEADCIDLGRTGEASRGKVPGRLSAKGIFGTGGMSSLSRRSDIDRGIDTRSWTVVVGLTAVECWAMAEGEEIGLTEWCVCRTGLRPFVSLTFNVGLSMTSLSL